MKSMFRTSSHVYYLSSEKVATKYVSIEKKKSKDFKWYGSERLVNIGSISSSDYETPSVFAKRFFSQLSNNDYSNLKNIILENAYVLPQGRFIHATVYEVR